MRGRRLEDILNVLYIFEAAYDRVQLVDPVKKQVHKQDTEQEEKNPLKCYTLWGKNMVCNDCVSIRAYRDNKTYTKIDYVKDEIYIVTAIPIQLEDRRVVLELFKNTTNYLILDYNESKLHSQLHSAVGGMNELVFKDALTGIYNRRFIDEKLPLDIVNANLGGKRLSIIMADIDFFKNVNDSYGHQIGDDTLRHFADILFTNLKRENDWVARYGGEEFLICLPSAKHQVAAELAEMIRKKVEESKLEYGGHEFKITASFGVSSVSGQERISMEELIGEADRKLYEAKNKGRNRVEA